MKRIFVLVAAVGIIVVLVVVGLRHRATESADSSAASLATVERGTVRRTVTADGTMQALTTVEVKSDVGGKVTVLAVDVGDKVKKGDLIAKIDPTDSETAYTQALAGMQGSQAQLDQARAQARSQPEMTRASIAQAQASYEAAAKELSGLQQATHPRARADAKAALDKATAGLVSANEDLKRLTTATHLQARTQVRSAVDQAKASLTSARENLTRLKKADQPQARTEAQATLDKAKSDLAVAEKELKRAKELRARGFVSQSSLEATENVYEAARASFASAQQRAVTVADEQAADLRIAEAQVEQARAALTAAQQNWDTLDADQAAEQRAAEARAAQAQADLAAAQRHWSTLDQNQAAELAVAQARLDQARAALDSARANAVQDQVRRADVSNSQAQVRKAQAEVDKTRTTLSYTTITAPRDGVILQKYVEEGSIITSGRSSVAEGMTIVELGDLTAMYVDVDLDETDLADIRVGQQVEIEVDAVEGKQLAGAVTRVDPQATTSTSITTVKVEVEVLDYDKRLMPGLSATCTFLAGEKTDILTLPARAIRQRDGKSYVMIPGDPEPLQVLVEVGLEGDELVEIVSGLNAGDQVILRQIGSASPSNMPGPPPGGGTGLIRGQ